MDFIEQWAHCGCFRCASHAFVKTSNGIIFDPMTSFHLPSATLVMCAHTDIATPKSTNPNPNPPAHSPKKTQSLFSASLPETPVWELSQQQQAEPVEAPGCRPRPGRPLLHDRAHHARCPIVVSSRDWNPPPSHRSKPNRSSL